MGCQKQEIFCCPHGCSLRCRAVSYLLPNVPGPSSAPDQPNRSHTRCLLSPAFLSFSRGFLLIHRAAWAVCRSGLWNPAPGGRLRVRALVLLWAVARVRCSSPLAKSNYANVKLKSIKIYKSIKLAYKKSRREFRRDGCPVSGRKLRRAKMGAETRSPSGEGGKEE